MLSATMSEPDSQKCKKPRGLNLDDMGLDKRRLSAPAQVQPIVKRRRPFRLDNPAQMEPGLGKPGSLGIKPHSELSRVCTVNCTDATDAPT